MIIEGRIVPGINAENPAFREVAEKFEASFLAEMLRETGLSASSQGFGGGVGEEQFAPLMADHYAAALVRAGGLGIADHIVAALMRGAADAE